ncbi:hypothetical protein ACTOWA_00015 [Herbaspirillum seropedicae]|uniref:hypothetical protein n=1 Tax=Herbaspirillum seropedicae TaxID=964 RepID=UPI003F8CF9FD
MNETMLEKLARSTNRITGRVIDKLAKLDLRLAVAIPAAAGAMIAMYGIVQEVHGQSNLLATGGAQAVHDYLSMCKDFAQTSAADGVWNYVKLAVANKLPTYGGAAQGIGAGVLLTVTPASAATVVLSRGLSAVRDWLSRESKGGVSHRLSPDAEPGNVLARFRAGVAEDGYPRSSARVEGEKPVTGNSTNGQAEEHEDMAMLALNQWKWDGKSISELTDRLDLIRNHLPHKREEWLHTVPSALRGGITYVASRSASNSEDEIHETVQIRACDEAGQALVERTTFHTYEDVDVDTFLVMSIEDAQKLLETYESKRSSDETIREVNQPKRSFRL